MALDKTEIAGIAINQLQGAEGVEIDPDRKQEAEFWADLALDDLIETYEIDPEYYYPDRAKQVAIAFTKLSLRGKDASVEPKYRRMADAWAMKAQQKKHEEEYDPDEYHNERIDFYET